MDLQNRASEENAEWYTVARPIHANVFIKYTSILMFKLEKNQIASFIYMITVSINQNQVPHKLLCISMLYIYSFFYKVVRIYFN